MSKKHDHDHDHDHDHGEHDHAHAHGHAHHHHHHGDAPSAIVRAIGITLVFMAVELIGGWYANSLALISDGAHMLTDVGAMLLSLFAIWVSRRPSTPTMSFGYHRAEILGALVSGLSIWAISGALIYEGIQRLAAPPEVQGPVVFVIATIGLAANLLSMRMLHHAKDGNMNARAAYLHMVSDSLGSVGAIIAGAVLWATGWRPIDPIVTFLFAALMFVNSWGLIKEAVGVLMESAPSHVDPKLVQKDLEALAGIKEVHDLHIWTVASGKLALSVHLITAMENALSKANELLKDRYSIIHTTIQVEHPDRFQSERCYDCDTSRPIKTSSP
ncbi:MAG: cation diffusion facilitator family transporter [Bdellovibrionota bacterium]